MQLCLWISFEERALRYLFSNVSGVYTVCLEGSQSCCPAQKGLSRGANQPHRLYVDWLQRRPVSHSYSEQVSSRIMWMVAVRSTQILTVGSVISQKIHRTSRSFEFWLHWEEGWEVLFDIIYPAFGLLLSESYPLLHAFTHTLGPAGISVLYDCPSGCSWLEQRCTTGLNYPPWI